MSSQIDATKPTSGTATTQSVRDNFTNAVAEIEALQGESGILSVTSSVAANALTCALKTSAGADATSTTGIEIAFRSSTLTTGTRTVRTCTAATSVVAPAGATLGFANSETDYVFIYAIDNAGTVELAISAAILDEDVLHSTTAISATADSGTVLYSTTARTNVPVRKLGRIKIQTGTTAGNWPNAATETSTTFGRSDSDVDTAKTNIAQEFTKTQNFNGTTLTFDATQDWNLETDQVTTLTLTANTTFDAPTNMVDGAFYHITIKQNGTGGYTVAWNAVFKFPAGTAPTITSTASAIDELTFKSDGTNMYLVSLNQNMS